MNYYHCSHADEAEKRIPKDEDAIELSDFLKVFGDPTRLKILFAILEKDLCVHDLSIMIHMNQSAVSHQLRILRQNRLVKVRKEGKSSFYSLDDDHVRDVLIKAMEHIKE